jgi:7-keto-8-aminopelargonate synthetase-like enzyme
MMRTGNAAVHARLLRLFERNAESASQARLSRVRIDDAELAGDIVTIDGNRLVNFGSCAYLGLNLDPRLKAGAVDAIERYGPVYSSSSAYTSVALYEELEDDLEQIVGAPVVVPTTTTLGHLACLPTVVGPGAAVIVDAQAHSSLHLACQSLTAEGIPVRAVPHNDLDALDTAITELSAVHDAVWYVADGVYSMLGDLLPAAAIAERLDRHENLWAYIDDAHAFGWQGLHGRGHVLDSIGRHPRLLVAASLSKSFGSGGAVIAFPDREMAHRVQICGGTLTFSGPLHPAELGAAVASAKIHLSDEHADLQRRLVDQIELLGTTASRLGLPIPNTDPTPIWFAHIGRHDDTVEIGTRMMKDGFYLNLASFPAVPPGQSGLRFTQTLYHSDDQIVAMLEALRYHFDAVLGTSVAIDLRDGQAVDLRSLEEAHPRTRG